ncbi:MAG: HIT domain-containing protein [Nanoarchaeota archaeon]
MLNPEQTEIVKKQLIQHIEKSFPEDKRAFAIEQIMNMSSEELEEFLRKNKLVPSNESSLKEGGCIFCSIIKGETNSYKIDEDKKAIAVFEINPLSKGHTIIVPKEHLSSSEEVPAPIFAFAKKIAKKIKTKLKPKNIEISSSNILGHEVINIIPIYEEEKPEKRQQAKPEELIELQKILAKKIKTIMEKKPKKIKIKEEEKIWLPKRIP